MSIRFLLLVLSLLSLSSFAQIHISIIDQNTLQTVPDAHLIHKGKVWLSNQNGIIKIPKDSLSGKAVISHIKYQDKLIDLSTIKASSTLKLSPKNNQLEEIILTAQLSGKRSSEIIKNIEKINAKDVEQYGAQSADQVLKWQSGLQINRDAVLGTSVSINGLSGEHIKILIDGVELNGRSDGFIDLEQLNLLGDQNIEIAKGPSSIEYGSNALGGVININSNQYFKKDTFGLRLIQLFDNTGSYQTNFRSFKSFKTHGFDFQFQRKLFDGWSENDVFWEGFGKTVADSSRFKSWAPKEVYFGKLLYQYKGKKLTWKPQVQYNREFILKRGLPFFAPTYHKAIDSKITSHRFIGQLQLTGKFNPDHNFKAQGNWQKYIRYRNGFLTDLSNLSEKPLAANSDTTNFVSTNIRFQGEWKSLEYGVDGLWESILGDRILKKEQNQTIIGSFLKYRWTIKEKHRLLAGLRANVFNNKSTPLIPSLSYRWDINSSLILKSSIAQGYRIASLKERFFEFIDNNHNIIGNDELKPESSNHFQLDLLQKHKKWQFQYAGFYNHITNPIKLATTNTDNQFTYFNLDEYRGLGGNIKASWQNQTWKFSLQSNLLWDQTISKNRNASNWNWNYQIGGNINYSPTNSWSLFTNIMYYGKSRIWRISNDSEIAVWQDPYAWWDLGTSYKMKKHWTFRFWVQNILDVKRVQSQSNSAHSSSSQLLGRGRMIQGQIQFTL
jgi:outer membrane receptor for ferrienterochelin and colicins